MLSQSVSVSDDRSMAGWLACLLAGFFLLTHSLTHSLIAHCHYSLTTRSLSHSVRRCHSFTHSLNSTHRPTNERPIDVRCSFVRSVGRCSVVRLFSRSFVRSIVRSVVRSLNWSFVRSFVGRLFVRSFVESVVRSFVRSIVRSIAHSLARSVGRSVIVHWFVGSLAVSTCSLRVFPIASFLRSFIWLVGWLVGWLIRAFLRSCVRALVCSFVGSSLFIDSPSCVRSFLPLIVRKLVCWSVGSSVVSLSVRPSVRPSVCLFFVSSFAFVRVIVVRRSFRLFVR